MEIVDIHFNKNKQVRLVVEMPNPEHISTTQSPHLPKMLFKLFPHLSRHRCHNDEGIPFRKECLDTEIPHLFEHLIIEIQGNIAKTSAFKGETEWDWRIDPRGRFYVTVDYDDEFLVLGSIRLAQRIINALDNKVIDAVNVEEEVSRLEELVKIARQIKEGNKPSFT